MNTVLMPKYSRRLSLLLAVPLLALLTGCGSLLTPDGAPAKLYSLTAPKTAAAGPRLGEQLLVDGPASALDLNSSRIAIVQTGGTEYFADVLWRDRAPQLLQGLLVEGFENSGRAPAVARAASGLRSDYLLSVELRDFQAERSGGSTRAHVRFSLKLVRATDRGIIAAEVFDGTANAATERFEDVIAAFNRATDDTIARAVSWTLAQATSARPSVAPTTTSPGPRR